VEEFEVAARGSLLARRLTSAFRNPAGSDFQENLVVNILRSESSSLRPLLIE
jgi:hypothetical protein